MESSTLIFTLVFVVAIAATALVFWIAQMILKATIYRNTSGVSEALARDALTSAMEKRSPFRIEILSGGLKDATVNGTCLELSKKYITLELQDVAFKHLQPGIQCKIYFQVAHKKSSSFYLFHGNILKAERKSANALVYFPFPQQLLPEQKRAFVRYTPSTASIGGIIFWELPPLALIPTKKSALERPILIYRKEDGMNNKIILENISAGGLRMSVDNTLKTQYEVALSIDERLILLLILKGIGEDTAPLAVWVVCHIRSIQHKDEEEMWHLGIQFVQWAKASSGQEDIEWFATNQDNCIPPLATWVMASHREQHKML